MSNYTALDLSLLPAPQVVEALDFETIFAAMLADLQVRDPAFDALVESDPAYKILEVCAYRELLIRQRVNDAARGVMLAYATGTDLDQIGALFGVQRLTSESYSDILVIAGTVPDEAKGELQRGENDTLYNAPTFSTNGGNFPPETGIWKQAYLDGVWRIYLFVDGLLSGAWSSADFYLGDPPLSPDGLDWSEGSATDGGTGVPTTTVIEGETITYTESDTEFRRRIQLALEGFSVAGPQGAYVFHALSASADILDVAATSPNPGEVLITVLSRFGTGAADGGLLMEVFEHLDDDSIRPLTDSVSVESATIIDYTIQAEIYTYPGPDSSLILGQATEALTAYIASVHRIGKDVSVSGIYAALHRPGVQRVNLISPTADITIGETEASYCEEVNVTIAGTDD